MAVTSSSSTSRADRRAGSPTRGPGSSACTTSRAGRSRATGSRWHSTGRRRMGDGTSGSETSTARTSARSTARAPSSRSTGRLTQAPSSRFARRQEGPANQLVLISTADGSVRVLRKIAAAWYMLTRARFSPDGRYIAFSLVGEGHPAHGDVYVMTADGRNEVVVAGHPAEDELLAWTPDGSSLALPQRPLGDVGHLERSNRRGEAAGRTGTPEEGLRQVFPGRRHCARRFSVLPHHHTVGPPLRRRNRHRNRQGARPARAGHDEVQRRPGEDRVVTGRQAPALRVARKRRRATATTTSRSGPSRPARSGSSPPASATSGTSDGPRTAGRSSPLA